MEKNLSFKSIKDIEEGKRKKYPDNPDFVSLFMSVDTNLNLEYYLYAACTKSDYTSPELIKVSKKDYNAVKRYFSTKHSKTLAENLLNNKEEILILLQMMTTVTEKESQTIGDMLNLGGTNDN